MPQFTYEVLPHEKGARLEYDGNVYRLDQLTDFEKEFLCDKTTYIRRHRVPEPAVEPSPPRPGRTRKKASP